MSSGHLNISGIIHKSKDIAAIATWQFEHPECYI